MMRFTFTRSHAYPGAQVLVSDDTEAPPACLVEFGDGVTVLAEWQRVDDQVTLNIPPYRTAAGTEIGARSWKLSANGPASYRVAGRLA